MSTSEPSPRGTVHEFPFAFEDRWRKVLRVLFGAHEGNSMVTVDDVTLDARFGRFRMTTPLSNCKDTQITRDYIAVKAIGARGSFKDLGVTFGSNTTGGVCVCFHEPVGVLLGRNAPIKHPGITLTVADLEGLKALLDGRIAAN